MTESASDFPPLFVERILTTPGLDGPALLDALRLDPSVSIRINRRKRVDDAQLPFPDITPVRWCGSGYYLPARPQFTLDPLLHAGAYYVQDASSMIYEQIISRVRDLPGLDAPRLVADLCAAPGGKTTAMINSLPDGTVVVANEYDSKRVSALRENIEKWGYPHTIVTNGPVSSLLPLEGCCDIVAVDAPCSGEGMMRKEPEAVRQWSPGLVRGCALLQREILEVALRLLRPGGVLIYSTCTFSAEENEENALWLLSKPGISPLPLPMEGVESCLPPFAGEVAGLRFMPHATRGEGLFVATFRKDPDLPQPQPSAPSRGSRRNAAAGCAALPEEALRLLRPTFHAATFKASDTIYALDPEMNTVVTRLAPSTRIVAAGVPVGELKGKIFIPSGKLLLSGGFRSGSLPGVEADRETALRYLRRESLTADKLPTLTSLPKGYTVVEYGGRPLGLVKNLGTRANNLLPTSWRIRNL